MEEENKKINFNVSSDTVDKVVDKLAVPLYEDLAKKSVHNVGDTGSTLTKFVHNFFLYPFQKYNIYAEDKLRNYAAELEKKSKAIPQENYVEPRVYILGPTVERLKYNLDEEYIKRMYTNILISEIDSRKQKKVLPSYIEVVNQLSHDDAKFLNLMKEKDETDFAIMKLKVNYTEENCYDYISHNILFITEDGAGSQWIDAIVIDNLLRLQLIELSYTEAVSNNSVYTDAFEKIKNQDYNIKEGNKLDYKKGILRITDFGINFINICMYQ